MRLLPGLVLILCAGMPVVVSAQTPVPFAVAAITSGDELTLADGRILRLEGVEQPYAETEVWRDKAREALKEFTNNRDSRSKTSRPTVMAA